MEIKAIFKPVVLKMVVLGATGKGYGDREISRRKVTEAESGEDGGKSAPGLQ